MKLYEKKHLKSQICAFYWMYVQSPSLLVNNSVAKDMYVQVYGDLEYQSVCLKKILQPSQVSQTRPPFNQRLITHSTRGFPVKIRPRGPPESQISETCHFQLFCYCHFKDDLQIRSHREKFNIVIFAQIFFRSQYTCGEARRKIWDKKSMLNFS